MKPLSLILAPVLLSLSGTTAIAQADYPSRQIELLVGFSAGGALDILARQAAPFLEKHLGGGDVVVINRPGAGGALMQTQLAGANPDGYTLGLLSMPGVVTVLFGGDVDYEIEDFEYSGTFTFEPHSVMVGMDTPFETPADLIAAARERPGEVTLGGAGIGSAAHLAALVLERAADVKFAFIPSPGAAEMQNQVMGGHIDGGVTTISSAYSRHQEQQARVIGTLSSERTSVAPDIATFAEAGYDVEWGALRGIAAPKGTPPEIMDKITEAIRLTLDDPEFQQIAAQNNMLLHFMDGDRFEANVRDIYSNLEEIWAEEPWIEE
ncbi:tripartite tricarboxylate transporter substrate binding protein [Natronohydrobacter thiooxidans]|jgi:tripartite-type tricarboxylate transporter receptor subunit TctC|uniref:tripartite tricarboxylate transporter substrate binding protein n=1 Tax=Natronohydrobacter thiooxidans TaxID=87172 RepID=UPI000A00EC97|nr:tripartite tricarboxylate transporter substrate binding protein [Natronohydrobacter thiooxidans]